MSRRGQPFIQWTEEDDKKLWELCKDRIWGDGEAWMRIGEQFYGRTVAGCKHRYDRLKLIRAGKVPPSRNRRRINPKVVRHTPEDIAFRMSPINLPPPTSLTAFICGDPLPGRSALDHKRLEESRA